MEEKSEIEQEKSIVWAYIKHPFDVIVSFKKNVKALKQEKSETNSLREELESTFKEDTKSLYRWGVGQGFFQSLSAPVVASLSKVPFSAVGLGVAAPAFFAIRYAAYLVSNHYSFLKEAKGKAIKLKKEKELARAYLNSTENKAEKYKAAAPKIGDALLKYVESSAEIRKSWVKFGVSATTLAIASPFAFLAVSLMSLYTIALRLYDMNAMKKNQIKEVETQNLFHLTTNNLINAASIVRETNNYAYTDKKLNEQLNSTLEITNKTAKKKKILDNKKIPFMSISNTIIWVASLYAGYEASKNGATALAGPAVFASALMASDGLAYSLVELVERYANRVSASREYQGALNSLNYQKSKVRTGERTLDTSRGHLRMKNVNFNYDTTHGVNDISLDFSKGKINVLTGESGSGKSTVFALLKHDLEAQSGNVSIDDINIQELTQESINEQIAYIAQEPVFLKTSVAEEMRLFNENATDDEIKNALSSVGLGKIPLDAPTYTEDEKPSFSGGQMQRLAIARALLRKSPILLMDEPTASLDATSKQEVWNAIEGLKKDRTVVVVSHDAFEIMNADNLALLENGKLTALGSPAELKENPYLKKVEKRVKDALKEEKRADVAMLDYVKMMQQEEEKGITTHIDIRAAARAKAMAKLGGKD